MTPWPRSRRRTTASCAPAARRTERSAATGRHPDSIAVVARSWHDVCSLDELAARGRVLARLGGREIGVVLDGAGRPHALRNRCPHHGAPLCLGRVRLREQGTPGSYAPAAQEVL